MTVRMPALSLAAVPGKRAAAVDLAATIAAYPWTCVVEDRASTYEGLGLGVEEGLANEDRHGIATLESGDLVEGLEHFARNQADRAARGERATGAP